MSSAKKSFIASAFIYFFLSILHVFYSTIWIYSINLLALAVFIILLLFTYTSFTNRRYVHLFVALVILVPPAFKIIYQFIS